MGIKMLQIKKTVIVLIAISIVLWLIMFKIDYDRACMLRKPIFAQVVNGEDDGGSGEYRGVFYRIYYDGYLDAEYGYTVIETSIYLFNKWVGGAIS